MPFGIPSTLRAAVSANSVQDPGLEQNEREGYAVHVTQARPVVPGEYYHLINRGMRRRSLFPHPADTMRLLFNILYFQSPEAIPNAHRIIKAGTPTEGFPIPFSAQERIIQKRFVELTAFCIMGNHFHLLVRETEAGGIARYMQRVLTGYTMYFNTRYESSGHVFQGRYQAVHVKDDQQLLYLSAYIHRNPRELRAWKGKEFEYPWSSLQDFTAANRWGGLIVPEIIVSQFEQTPQSNYADFVRSSTAKLLEEELATPPQE